MKTKLSIFFLLLFAGISLNAGPWPKNTGHGYFKLAEYWIIADQHFTDTGDIDPNVTNGFFSSYIYGEYGFTDKVTGVVYFPFFSRAYYNNTVSGTTGELLIPGESVNGLGDAEIGLTYGIYKNNSISLSSSIVLGLPLGISNGGSQANLQTGDGEFNQLLKLDLGASFTLGQANGWIASSVGYNNRTNGFSDEVISSFQAGITLMNGKLIPSIRLESRQSRYNGDPDLTLNFTSVFSNNVEYVSITPELAYKLNDRLGVSFAFGATLSGRVIFARPSYAVGVFYDLQ